MILWRTASFLHDPLDGVGAALLGARWNAEGQRAVYTSETASLSLLERLGYVDPEELPADLMLYRIAVPDDAAVEAIPAEELPANWRQHSSAWCRRLGSEWITRAETALLRVPSVHSPVESNVLINPQHPDAARIVVEARIPYEYDVRLTFG